MKFVLILAFLFGVSSQAQDFRPTLVTTPPEAIFTPMGFDDNDLVHQIVLWVNLPSSCDKAGKADWHVAHEQGRIYIRNQTYHYDSAWCLNVSTPYPVTVSFERKELKAGTYEIWVEKDDGKYTKMGALPIAKSKASTVDDYVYMPVESARLAVNEGSKAEVLLKGRFDNACMVQGDVKVLYRKRNVIEILPVALWQPEGKDCSRRVRRPFELRVAIKPEYVEQFRQQGTDAAKGLVLLHVRSLSGHSVNQVVNFLDTK